VGIVSIIRAMIAPTMKAVRTSETSAYSNKLHGAISHKALLTFILAAVRT
jgi:hypothetical protein